MVRHPGRGRDAEGRAISAARGLLLPYLPGTAPIWLGGEASGERRVDAFLVPDPPCARPYWVFSLMIDGVCVPDVVSEYPHIPFATALANAKLIPRMDETDRHLLALAPPIGIGGDCCTYVEIIVGARLGAIMYTDGEMYPGYFDEVYTDWASPPDALIDQFVESGLFVPVAPSFGALIDKYARLV